MKILIAPDSFKDCMLSDKVAEHIKRGVQKAVPEAEIITTPLADGGEGTVEAMVKATGGRIVNSRVYDPLMRKRDTYFGILGDNTTGIIGMSAASGIELLKKEERNPALTTTFGTGELIKHALDSGCKKLIVGIGGSATCDGGVGMLQALGVEFLDSHNKPIRQGGMELLKIRRIVDDNLDPRLKYSGVKVACDVTNPLYGSNGAAYVYGPQKGASPDMVKKLDSALRNYGRYISEYAGYDITSLPGSGAAGGIGVGLIAFLKTELVSGAQLIMETIDFEKKIEWADIVITGEGTMDEQTLFGKVPFWVAQIALKHKKPVIGIAGLLGTGYHKLLEYGFTNLQAIISRAKSMEDSMKNAGILIEELTAVTFSDMERNIS